MKRLAKCITQLIAADLIIGTLGTAHAAGGWYLMIAPGTQCWFRVNKETPDGMLVCTYPTNPALAASSHQWLLYNWEIWNSFDTAEQCRQEQVERRERMGLIPPLWGNRPDDPSVCVAANDPRLTVPWWSRVGTKTVDLYHYLYALTQSDGANHAGN
jgi:hypothetical protein